MNFAQTLLPGVVIVEPEPIEDARGMFARVYCAATFRAQGMWTSWPQTNISFNKTRGTLRGMHFQRPPFEEPKLVRCTRGRIYDVVVDIRRDSATFRRWIAVELNEENHLGIYIPQGFAHGFQTLVDECEVFYQMGETYHPELAAGVRWNDKAFGIEWPIASPTLSSTDATYPDFL